MMNSETTTGDTAAPGDVATAANGQPGKTRWTIQGISPETRTAVRNAAAKEGRTIGQWIDMTLRTAAEDSLKGGTSGLSLPSDLLATIDDISHKLDDLKRDLHRYPEINAFSVDFTTRIDDLRGRLNSSIDRLQTTTHSVVDTVTQRGDEAITRSMDFADRALQRLRDTSDAALDSVRRLRRSEAETERVDETESEKG